MSNIDFNNITKQITKTKEKVFNTTKNCQIKEFNFLKRTPAYRNTPVLDIIKKKWVINLSRKPLTDGEQSLLQKGPKFAVCSSRVPLTEYIAVTKRICDELGENTTGKDCTEIYQKNKEILQHYKKKSNTHNITKQEKEAIKTLREEASHVVLTADKGVALVVMDKSQYVNKCMALLDDTKVYKPCKDTTKKLQRHPRNPQTAQQGTWFFQTTLVEANTITTNCSPQVTHLQHLDSMVYLKFTKLIALCDP